jgi:galactokinase
MSGFFNRFQSSTIRIRTTLRKFREALQSKKFLISAEHSLREEFIARFKRQPRLFRAPGRVNIIGEHCDYNDGFVMPVNTALYTWLAISPRDDRLVRVHSINFDHTQTLHLDELRPGGDEQWFEYIKSVVWVLQDEGVVLSGADVLIHGEIPLGGGLSSSASLETVFAYGLMMISAATIDRGQLAQWCQRAENEFVGVNCGIMDQYVISLSASNQAMKLDCRSLQYDQVALPVSACILVVDTGVHHQLKNGGFKKRRRDCEHVVSILGQLVEGIVALRDVSPAMLELHRGQLDDQAYRRARHVVTEIQRVALAQQAMLDNDLPTLGQILNDSHASLRDDFEVSSEELDALTGIARSCEGVYGARMVGAGFGGCIISLVKLSCLKAVIETICLEYSTLKGSEPWWHVVAASDPVGEVKP